MADKPRMRMDAAFDDVFGPGSAPKDLGKQLGESLLEGILAKVAAKAPSLIGGETDNKADWIQSLGQELLKQRLLGGGSEGGFESGTMGALASMFRASQEGQVAMTKTLMEMQSKAEERMLHVVQQQGDQFREVIDRLEKKMEGEGAHDPFRNIGLQLFQNQLQRDPVEEERQRRQAYYEEYRAAHPEAGTNVISLELAKFDRELALRERQEEREARREAARLEAQGKGLSALGALLTGRAADPAGDPDTPPPAPQFYRYKCSDCGTSWSLPQPRTQMICPGCGQHLNVGPPPGEAGADTVPPSAPPEMQASDLVDAGF